MTTLLSETYRRIARAYFPNALIVADRFHVVRLVNQHFLKLWQQYDPEGRRDRGLLSLMRRHHWKLGAVQKARLHQYLAQDPVLHALYFAKQQLNGFLVMKTLNQQRVREILPKFLRLLGQFECNQPSVMNALSPDNGVEPTIHATKKKSPPGRVAIRR